MKTLDIMFTRADRGTQPGGVILRQQSDGTYVTHRFNRIPHTRGAIEFFWGHYFTSDDAERLAREDFQERCDTLRRNYPDIEISEAELIAKGDANLQPFGSVR